MATSPAPSSISASSEPGRATTSSFLFVAAGLDRRVLPVNKPHFERHPNLDERVFVDRAGPADPARLNVMDCWGRQIKGVPTEEILGLWRARNAYGAIQRSYPALPRVDIDATVHAGTYAHVQSGHAAGKNKQPDRQRIEVQNRGRTA